MISREVSCRLLADVATRAAAWAKAVEKVRGKQIALKEREVIARRLEPLPGPADRVPFATAPTASSRATGQVEAIAPSVGAGRLRSFERDSRRACEGKDRLRLNDLRRNEQARPESGHSDRQGLVCRAVEHEAATPQGDAEWIAKKASSRASREEPQSDPRSLKSITVCNLS
jgi:hypothetical protein